MNCQTISADDLVTVVGRDFVEATPFGDIACTWIFADMPSGASAGPEARVYVRWANDDTTLESTKSANPGGEDVSIGDRGYWADGASTLYFAKGVNVYAIDLSGLDTTDPLKDIAIKIAELLVPKV